jgi:hypothetical protein
LTTTATRGRSEITPQAPTIRRSHGTTIDFAVCESAACGAINVNPWKPPGQTCNSARPPARQIRDA